MRDSQNLLQKAFAELVRSIQPGHDKYTFQEIERARNAIAESGRWQEFDEWRISTCFDSAIERLEHNGKTLFKVRVACDGQEFICICPTLDKAVLLSKFYRRIIMDQFYSVGPPWA